MATYRYTNITANGASLKLNERPVYGSSRLGSLRKEEELHTVLSFQPQDANPIQQVDLNYELTDHLGNVTAVITGRLLDGNGGGTPKQAELVSAQGYEAFGSLLPGRNYSSNSYRFGFQGQEKDDEMHGATGTSYAYTYRSYDPRIGRFFAVDPLTNNYPWYSPYQFCGNKVIQYRELEGLEEGVSRMVDGYSRALVTMSDKEVSENMRTGLFMLGAAGVLVATGGTAARFAPHALRLLPAATSAAQTSPLWAPELASFAANLFYEGPDDAFPTPGPGGELGKALRGTSKAFKGVLSDLLSKSIETNVSKKIVAKVSGTVDDALNQFNTMTEGASSTRRIIRDGRDIRISTMEDGTTVSYRNFSDSERTANAVIEVNHSNVGDKVDGRALEVKFFDAPKE